MCTENQTKQYNFTTSFRLYRFHIYFNELSLIKKNPEMPLKQFNVGLREDSSFWPLGGRSSSAFSCYVSLLVAIDGVASLGFVPAGFVSSPSSLQIFQEAVHLWWFLCPLVYVLGQFPWLVHTHDSTVTCWICKHFFFLNQKCRTCQNVNGKPLYLYRQFPTSIFSSCRKHWCISSDRLRGWWVVAMTTTGYCFCCDVSSVMFR